MISFLDARCHGGEWLLRIEDIDPPREVDGAAQAIIDALALHGLHHDSDLRFQSASLHRHESAIAALLERGHAYFCQCSRRQLRAAGHTQRYPGTCRDLGHTEGAVRVRVPQQPVVVEDRWQGQVAFDLDAEPGDFIVQRGDGLMAYQIAVVVDDAEQGVTHIVRGFDLFDSTPRQVWLQQLLGLKHPSYAHFPVLLGADGRKLSKQTGAAELDSDTPVENLTAALQVVGLPSPPRNACRSPETLVSWALAHYEPSAFAGVQSFANKA